VIVWKSTGAPSFWGIRIPFFGYNPDCAERWLEPCTIIELPGTGGAGI